MSFAYMALYTGDYLRDTRHLSMAEHGCYLLMLMHCWDQRGPLPKDERKLIGICNARSSDEIEAMRRVVAEFFVEMTDGLYNSRIQKEIERSHAISGKRSYAALQRHNANAQQVLANAMQEVPTPPPSLSLSLTPEITTLSDSPSANQDIAACREILDFLRRMTGRKYREVDANIRMIRSILRKTPMKEVKETLAYMGDKWGNDPKMAVYLRPKTLFAAANFENYYAEAMANAN